MKINRMSSETSMPNWALGIDEQNIKKENPEDILKLAEVAKLIPEVLSEDILVSEREKIDICASAGETYYYSEKWAGSDVNKLKEYASVCGLTEDSLKAINPDEFVKANISRSAGAKISKIASTSAPVSAFEGLKLNDPFHLEEIEEEKTREDWQKVKSASKLDNKPSMLTNAVIPIGGGEDYFANSDTPLAKNQNSIVNPTAIEQLAKSEQEDNGVRLAREAREREEAGVKRHAEWQKNKTDEMEHFNDLPRGTVFPTEVMNAQPGLNSPSSQMGVYASFDKDSIPEKTIGETISEKNTERKEKIQGKVKVKHEFSIQAESSRTISDPLYDSLKKSFGKK